MTKTVDEVNSMVKDVFENINNSFSKMVACANTMIDKLSIDVRINK
jgi:hypothetical protein